MPPYYASGCSSFSFIVNTPIAAAIYSAPPADAAGRNSTSLFARQQAAFTYGSDRRLSPLPRRHRVAA